MVIFFLIILISLLIAISDRGLQSKDEGFYWLFSNPFQENIFRPTNLDILYKYIYNNFGFEFNVSLLRITRIGINILGSLVLFFGLYNFNQHILARKAGFVDLLAFVIFAGFWSYLPTFIQTPGYDFYNYLGLQLFSGGLLFIISNNKNSFLLCALFSLLSVLGILICWIAKPTGIPFILLILFIALYINRYHIHTRTLLVFSFFFISIFLYFFLLSDFANRINPLIYKKVFQSLQVERNTHSFDILVIKLIRDVFLFLIAILSGVLIHYLITKKKLFFVYILIVLGFTIAFFEFFLSAQKYNLVNQDLWIFLTDRCFLFIPLILAFTFGYFLRTYSTRGNILLPCFFFTITLSYVFGTNSNNLYSAISCLQFLLIAVWLIMPITLQQRYFKIILFILIGILLTGFLFPYNKTNIWSQKVPFKYGRNRQSVILLDQHSYNIQNKLRDVVSKFKTPYIVGYTRMLHHIYLLDKTTPGSILWGEEDVNAYFKYRFNNPDSFLLFLGNKIYEPFIFNFIKLYKVSFVTVIYTSESLPPKDQIYIYFCQK